MTFTPQRRRATLGAVTKRLLVGRPISSHAELHHRLNKRLGLAVFSSDALSSSAYATDEILLALAAAGTAALSTSIPIALAVAFVLGVVVVSYRQTVRAYPSGGGAYIVAHDNLGESAGLMAASSLLIDYVLTVSVSVAAGIAAIGAAFPGTREHRVGAALVVILFISLANLRGLKESGTLFSIPTYGFLVTVGGMIVFGLFKVVTNDFTPLRSKPLEVDTALTAFLILRAFASGSTALTGVEAISNGVPAFKPPESKNAAQTLLVLGILLSFLFLGITLLANAFNVDPEGIEHGDTVPSQIAGAVFGVGSALFYLVQFFTAFILFLAANTSYADFPRLSSILAHDRYLPRVLQNRGDKLAFSNGIVFLAVAAAGVIINYSADVHRIIPLYVIGVFTSFTLSQGGMVRRWIRLKTPAWRRSALVNGFGATTTFVVLIIVSVVKFSLGAWQVIILIPFLALLLRMVNRHYSRVSKELRLDRSTPEIEINKVVMLVSPLVGATVKALSFCRVLGPQELRVVGFRVSESRLQELRGGFQTLGLKNPIEATGHRLDDLIDYVRGLEPSDERPVTVVLPDPQSRSAIVQLLRGRLLLRIKRLLLAEPGVVVISVPFHPDVESIPERIQAPTRFSVIVLVSAVHRATLRALEYARSLQPSELKAVSIATDSRGANDLLEEWERWEIQFPLEIVDSPYRSIVEPLLKEIRTLRSAPTDAVAVVIPEFLVPHWWQQLLHGQTALLIKTALLFQPNVFVINVPYPIGRRQEMASTPARSQKP